MIGCSSRSAFIPLGKRKDSDNDSDSDSGQKRTAHVPRREGRERDYCIVSKTPDVRGLA